MGTVGGVEDLRWARLVAEHRQNQRRSPVEPVRPWIRRLVLGAAAAFATGGAWALLQLAVADTRPQHAPPGALEAAHAACGLPQANISAIEDLGGGRWGVECSFWPFGWPSRETVMTCGDGEWNGPSGIGSWGSYGISCRWPTDDPAG